MVEQTQKLGSWLCNQCLLISNSSQQVFIEIYGVLVTILCGAKDEKDEFEITPHLQGRGRRDNVEEENDSHLSSAVNLLGGPGQLTLSVWGCFLFNKLIWE